MQRMLDVGLLDRNKVGGVQDVIDNRAYFQFYMHRTGHWLGLDVHDAGEYKIGDTWRPLVPGMMLTVEPGCYIRPADDVPRAFWNIGIRIEDYAIVTETGCELITRGVPVKADEIEALMTGQV